MSLATCAGQFTHACRKDTNLDVRSLLKLPTGQAHAAFRDASDPSWSDHAQWLWLRDTVIDPGGKTLTAL